MKPSLRRACTVTLLLTTTVLSADRPPVAPVRPVTDQHWGVKVEDPYRYMEDFKSPEVQSWVKAQADHARATLSAIPGRDAILARLIELDEGVPWRLSVVRRWPSGDLHYLKRLASENLDKLYFRPNGGDEQLLIDPEKITGPAGGHVALAFAVPSPDARYVAYGLAEAGSEQTVLHVLDTHTKSDLPADVIDRMESDYTWPCWLPDSSGFVYSRRNPLPPGAPPTDGYKNTKAFLHRLGTDPARDVLLLAAGTTPAVPLAETDFPSIVLTHGSPYAIGKIRHGDARELTLYAAPLEDLTGEPSRIRWRKICDAGDQVADFTVHADQIFLTSWKDAPRYRVLRQSLASPGFAAAQTILPAGQRVIESIAAARDALYVGTMEGAIQRVLRLSYEPSPAEEPITLPEGETGAYVSHAQPDVDGIHLITASWTRAGRLYAYDPASHSLTDTKLRPIGKFDAVPGFESHEILVPSHDGVPVPLSIIHKSGLTLDGSHPTLVIGYGSYGTILYPSFRATNLAWLERGGILAFAHVRGGGEYGRQWHEAGKGPTKPNTWKDFLACCQYLVDHRYTSPAKLAGTGGSAGGILIGRAITTRPDLFAAAVIGVGVCDTLRMETTTNGVPNIPEFGTVQDRAGFHALLEMSPYAHVKDGTKYPAVLLVHGINDPRVEPWMSAKMTARLQAATASPDRPVLFRVDYDAGHGIGSTKRQRQEQTADEWSFLLWQMGEMDK